MSAGPRGPSRSSCRSGTGTDRDDRPAPKRPRRETGRTRAQTAVDYGIGIGVFLLVVGFVFAFVPSMFTPFTSSSGELLIVADRGGDQLTADLLVEDPADPTVLNATCTAEFFDADGDTGDCRFDADGSDLRAALSISRPGADVNVTVRDAGGSVRTLDGTRLAVGGTPPRSADVALARRSVLLDGRQSRLVVRVW